MPIAPLPEDTEALAASLGRLLRAGDVIGLVGDLGAGKTVFVKGLARGLGVPAETLVTSPTFTLVHIYEEGRTPLFHVDLYRLDDESQLLDVGLDDLYRRDGVVAVEWMDKFPRSAPREMLEVKIVPEGEGRLITATASGARAEELLLAWLG
jgi:tRNA threonylcarbamoyladenosine biosynthesis protein TsaE